MYIKVPHLRQPYVKQLQIKPLQQQKSVPKAERIKTAKMGLTRFHQAVAVIFILVVFLGKSFSEARKLKGSTAKEVVLEEGNGLSLNKEILDPTSKAPKAQTSPKKRGRKASQETRHATAKTTKERSQSSKKLAIESSAAVRSSRDSKHDDVRDHFMAFSADYRSPKQHPPRNN